MIKAVIFDMDGVLVDSEQLINESAIAMFKRHGHIVQPDDFLPFVGAGEDRYVGGVAEKYGIAINIKEAKRETYDIYLSLVSSRIHAFPGVHEILDACKKTGLLTAVASSADRIKVEANLAAIGHLWETWDTVVTAEDVKNKKPAPDIFLKAANKIGVEPENCTVVEDAINGIEAACAAGMRSVAVTTSFPAHKLGMATLIRHSIAMVTLADLLGE